MVFENFRDQLFPIIMEQDLFGEIRYLRSTGYWEGSVEFLPESRVVEIFVPTQDKAAPSEWQLLWYQELVSRYPALKVGLYGLLREAGSQFGQPNADRFRLVSITFPLESITETQWELTFERSDTLGQYDVRMNGWEAVEITAEL